MNTNVTENTVRSKLHLNKTVILLFTLFISCTEFFPYISKIFYFPLVVVFVLYLYTITFKPTLKLHVIFYGFFLSFFATILFLTKNNINGLLFFPIIAWFTYIVLLYSIKDKEIKKSFDYFLKCIVVFILAFSFLEILIKLNFVSFDYYSDFVKNYGDRRFDVLRTRVLWGSSLSSAAVGIFLTFYFSLVRKDFAFLSLTFLYITLTGGRTGIVLFILMLFISLTKSWNFWRFKLSRKNVMLLMAMVPCLIFSITWLLDTRVGDIVSRSFTIKADSSFTGRGDTTGVVFEKLLLSLPESLFWGLLENDWVSDSAFTSIAAQSGILLLISFLGYLFFLLFKTTLDAITKMTFIVVSIIGSWTIGDFFIPAVTFLYAITFLIYEKNTTCYYRAK